MEVTAEKRARGGFTITHMLHSIIPSFVRRTMRARGAGLKKDRHTAIASDPGETRAKPEVSEKKIGLTQNLFFPYFLEDITFDISHFVGLKGKLTTENLLSENKQYYIDQKILSLETSVWSKDPFTAGSWISMFFHGF